jgi:hypothetical protein
LLPSSQSENQGENLDSILDNDFLLKKIQEIKKLTKEKAESKYQKAVKAVKTICDKQKHRSYLDHGADVSAKNILKERRNEKDLKRKSTFQVGDKVRIKTIRFGKRYAKDLPEFTQGKVVKIKGKKAGVVYDGGEEIYDTYLAHHEKIGRDYEAEQGDVLATVHLYSILRRGLSKKTWKLQWSMT